MTIAVTIDAVEAAYGAPPGGGPFPGVVVLHEIVGLNDDIRSFVDRFVAEGYAAVAPDLFAPGLKPICIARAVVDLARRQGRVTLSRVEVARRWLSARPEVDSTRVGVIGFCLGGGLALMVADDGYAAASVNYGRVPADVSALEGVCPVVASYGADDRQLRGHPERLEAALVRAGVAHDVKTYPGVGHSFLNQSAPRWLPKALAVGYDANAAEDAWRRILAFFAEHLGDAGTT